MILPSVRRERSQQCLFFQVNHSLLSKSYERNSGELTFGQDETSLKLGRNDFDLREKTLGETICFRKSSFTKFRPSHDRIVVGALAALASWLVRSSSERAVRFRAGPVSVPTLNSHRVSPPRSINGYR